MPVLVHGLGSISGYGNANRDPPATPPIGPGKPRQGQQPNHRPPRSWWPVVPAMKAEGPEQEEQ